MKQHTPTPWRLDGPYITNQSGLFIASVLNQDGIFTLNDAQHIVHCVNTHDALVDSLEEMIESSECTRVEEPMIKALEVLKLAKEGQE